MPDEAPEDLTDPEGADVPDDAEDPVDSDDPEDLRDSGDSGERDGRWPRGRLDVGAGVVLVAYAVWVAVQLGALVVDEGAFDALTRLHAGVVGRLLVCVVVLAALWHTVQGVLALVAGQIPAVGRRQGAARQVCAFVTLALGVPAMAVVLWPVLAGIPT